MLQCSLNIKHAESKLAFTLPRLPPRAIYAVFKASSPSGAVINDEILCVSKATVKCKLKSVGV